MKNIKLKNKKIKIFISLTLLFLVTFSNARAISLADIEFLISIGVISPDQANFARQAAQEVNQQSVASSIKNDPNSEFECLIFNQNLVKGNSGSVVSAMQRFLQRLGHFPNNQSVTGFYGDLTVQAVADFQLAYGLITSRNQIGAGAVGPITRSKIQQISCNQLNSPTPAPAPSNQQITTPLPQTNIQTPVVNVPVYVPSELEIKSIETYRNEERGVYHFRYDLSVEPNDYVKYFKITLVCDPENTITNRDDLKRCGDSVNLKASTRGKKSIKIGFTNTGKNLQTLGIGVEAYGENNKLLDFEEIINELPAAKPVTYIEQTLANGQTAKYGIPEPRNCDPNEQLTFMKYIMTITQDPKNPLIPPTCWPGDILCDTAINYPPTYCQIPNGPTSNDLCPVSKRFYNGKCIDRSV